MLCEFAVVYIDAPPQCREVERFIYPERKTIYINVSATAGAKLVKLSFAPHTAEQAQKPAPRRGAE